MPSKILLLLLATLLAWGAGDFAWAAKSQDEPIRRKAAQVLPKKKKTVEPETDEVNDTEEQFFNTEEEPPAEDPPIEPEAAGAEYTQDEPSDDLVESNQNPDDEGIEYADEAEKNERERQKKILERKKALETPKPPLDEPMPLIKRQREALEMSTKQNNKFIRHPYARKGLIKITKDKTYIYRTKVSDQKNASSLRFGFLEFQQLENPETNLVFTDFYESGNFAFVFDYEWQIFKKFGKLGLKVGTGVGVASGNGQFKSGATLNGAIEPKEKFTFALLPNTAGAILRLQFWDNQIFVPYGEGGGAAFAFGEFRDDGKNPRFGGAFGGYFAFGLNVNLNFLDTISLLELDREYSINSVYLGAEYRYYVGVGNFDFTSSLINGGLTLEF